MPHNVLAIVLKHIENSPLDQAQAGADAWQLIVMWCVMAAQADQQGDSLVAFSVDAVMECNDAYFGQWVENCLNSTMDCSMGATMAVTPLQGPAHLTEELGKGVAMGLHALGTFKTPSMTQGGGGVVSQSKQG